MECICNICTCGRHHCPYIPTKIYEKVDKPRNASQYTENYPLYPNFQPVVSCKPKIDYQQHPARMEGKSIFRIDYVPHDVRARTPKKRVKYEPKAEIMDMNSTYKIDYNPYKIHPVSSFKPIQTKFGCPVKMDALSTYKGDYRAWHQAKRESLKPDSAYVLSGKFEDATTFRDDFQFKGLPFTQSCKPPNVAQVLTTPMEQLSNYRIEYIPYCYEKREVHEKAKYKPSDVPFDSMTTNRRDFKGAPGEPAKLIRPAFIIPSHDVPFSNSTEFQDKYRAWPQPPLCPKKPFAYVPPDEKMDFLTSHKCDYTVQKVKTRSPFIPLIRMKKSAPFNSNSTMREDYREWKYAKPEKNKSKDEWQTPKDPFEGLTTFRQDYTEKPCPFATSYKPPPPPPKCFIPLYSESIYATSYTPKPMHKCPASYKDPPGYVYEETDSTGHRLYRHISQQDFSNLESTAEGTKEPVKDIIRREKTAWC